MSSVNLMLKRVGRIIKGIRKKEERPNLGLLIDGPNFLKSIWQDLGKIKEILEEIGDLKVAKTLTDQNLPDEVIETIKDYGFSPIIVQADADIYLALEAMELIFSDLLDIIALATTDTNFFPIMARARELGKETAVLGGKDLSDSLKNVADYVVEIFDEEEEEEAE